MNEQELREALKKDFNQLLVKEFTTDWKIQRLKIGLDIDVMSLDNALTLIQSATTEVRKQERSLAIMYLHDTNRLQDYKKCLQSLQNNKETE